jgi:HlyD family secretion protein
LIGQRVAVYLDNYSFQEYGTLSARIEDFSELPHQGFYRVIISFPEGLKTKYGNLIPARPNLQGQAEIITEEHRLIERLFYKLRANAFTKNTL